MKESYERAMLIWSTPLSESRVLSQSCALPANNVPPFLPYRQIYFRSHIDTHLGQYATATSIFYFQRCISRGKGLCRFYFSKSLPKYMHCYWHSVCPCQNAMKGGTLAGKVALNSISPFHCRGSLPNHSDGINPHWIRMVGAVSLWNPVNNFHVSLSCWTILNCFVFY